MVVGAQILPGLPNENARVLETRRLGFYRPETHDELSTPSD